MLIHHKEHQFRYETAEVMSQGLVRITANNPGPFTFHGSGTFILGTEELAIIDPGPNLDSHFHALINHIGNRTVSHILVTHRHADHAGLARRLSQQVHAPIYGWLEPVVADNLGAEASTPGFQPEEFLADNQIIKGTNWELQSIHTPGHTSDHICYIDHQQKWVFCGDHIMAWSTSVVLPPDGDMGDYVANLRRMEKYSDYTFWPTHGTELSNPAPYIQELIQHRIEREAAILELLASNKQTIPAMVEVIYKDVPKSLHKAAGQSVLATLIDLEKRGRVSRTTGFGHEQFFLN